MRRAEVRPARVVMARAAAEGALRKVDDADVWCRAAQKPVAPSSGSLKNARLQIQPKAVL